MTAQRNKFSEDQPRDEHGRWSETGAGGDTAPGAPRTTPMFASGTTGEYDKALSVVSGALAFQPQEGEPDIKHRVLFHSNSQIDAATLREGLEPELGAWVQETLAGATDEEINWEERSTPVVFLSDDPKWVEVQVARKLDKPVRDITDSDVRTHGVLAIVTNVDTESGVAKYDDIYRVGATVDGGQTEVEDPYGKTRKLYETSLYEGSSFGPEKEPQGLEPGDFVTASALVPDVVLTGNDLVQFLDDWRGGLGRRSKHTVVRLDFDPNQPRDESGKWTSGGGGASAAARGSNGGQGVTASPAFKQWFGDSKVVDDDGEPLVVFHGTAGDFNEFDPQRANPESDLGAGFYFTSGQEDVGTNYAGEGPDLTNRIEQARERYAQSLADEHPDWSDEQVNEEAGRAARDELSVVNAGLAMPVYLKIENPVVLGGDRETFLDLNLGMDADGEFTGNDSGKLIEFVDALKERAMKDFNADFDDAANLGAKLYEQALDNEGLGASEVYKTLRSNDSVAYITDDEGRLAGNELIRSAFEDAGFDGIIDRTVHEKFGTHPRPAPFPAIGMVGVNPDTVHYVVFDPKQIKSAIGNSGSFDPKNPDITKHTVVRLDFDPNQPRDESGKWTSAGGGGGGADSAATSSTSGGGSGDDQYLQADGKYHVKGDVEAAARLIAQDKDVVLEQPHELSTLLDKLAGLGRQAAAGGEKKVYDLCRVSVSGTNLFCAESKGYARVTMPQLAGYPTPGSIADKMPRDPVYGGVDATDAFIARLRSDGFGVDRTSEDAGYLRASQRELDGVKVAGIMQSMLQGRMDESVALVVSKDNYIIDGHHRWAAQVALSYAAQVKIVIPVQRVDIGVVELLDKARDFATEIGLPQMAVGKALRRRCGCASKAKPCGCKTVVRLDAQTLRAAKRPGVVYAEFRDDQPRDEHGRWTSGGGSGGAAGPKEPTATPPSGYIGPAARVAIQRFETVARGSKIEHFKAVNEAGESFEKSGDVDHVNFTNEEIEKLYALHPSVYSHNHPSNNSFSTADVAFAGRIGAKELRAVTNDGAYVMQMPDRFSEVSNLLADAENVSDEQHRDWWSQIDSGAITREWANAHHHDAMWKKVAALPQWRDTLDYSFEPKGD